MAIGGKKSAYALALVKFDRLEALQYVNDVLSSQNLLNEDKAPISVGIAFDTRVIGEQKWVGVVLRNLPQDASVGGILKNFKSPQQSSGEINSYKIISVEVPQKIKHQVCTVM